MGYSKAMLMAETTDNDFVSNANAFNNFIYFKIVGTLGTFVNKFSVDRFIFHV